MEWPRNPRKTPPPHTPFFVFLHPYPYLCKPPKRRNGWLTLSLAWPQGKTINGGRVGGRGFRGFRGYHGWTGRARIIRQSFTPKPRCANPEMENRLDRCVAVLRYPAASDTLRNSTRTDRSRSSERPPFGQTRGFLPQAETPTPTERHRALPTRFRHDPRICDTPCRASAAWMRRISST